MNDRGHLLTEKQLRDSANLDAMSIAEAVSVMNSQDSAAVAAVRAEHGNIVAAIELIVAAFRGGGRLLYVGAGTSGRLGALDAAECPPTFRTDPQMVQGIIAGGERAMFRSIEGAEDNGGQGAAEMDQRHVGENDVVVGIAAGGTTPFVQGALRRARELGARTVFITCVEKLESETPVDVAIRPLVGPEVITGSTRLKAGTATKLVLNALSTVAMVQLGKVYGNLMVDLKASNQKLWDRGARIISTLTGLDRQAALSLLEKAEGHVKPAILMHKRSLSLDQARAALDRAAGRLRAALGEEPPGR